MGNSIKRDSDLKTKRKEKAEIMEMKSSRDQIKNLMKTITSRLHQVEENITGIKDKRRNYYIQVATVTAMKN
jgi:hypothetical protein